MLGTPVSDGPECKACLLEHTLEFLYYEKHSIITNSQTLTKTLQRRCLYCPHFTDQDTSIRGASAEGLPSPEVNTHNQHRLLTQWTRVAMCILNNMNKAQHLKHHCPEFKERHHPCNVLRATDMPQVHKGNTTLPPTPPPVPACTLLTLITARHAALLAG